MHETLRVIRWGRTVYTEALAQQQKLQTERLAGQIADCLILTEHEPVFTLGLRGGAERHLLWDRAQLASEKISLAETNRGGDITYHGPGQLVAYPIVSLESRRDLHAYLRLLEEVLVATVARYGLAATRREGLTGIWVGRRKLAAIGVAVRRWVTMHGVALNVCPQLAHFSGIVPCGIASTEGTVTSLAHEIGPSFPSLVDVGEDFAEEFSKHWQCFGSAAPNHF